MGGLDNPHKDIRQLVSGLESHHHSLFKDMLIIYSEDPDRKPLFVGGIILVNRTVARCAPIIGYMVGWSEQRVLEYAKKRSWRVEELAEE